MFVHDALSELVLCGETDIPAADIRISINNLKKTITGENITGFQKQFQVYLLHFDIIINLNTHFDLSDS